jgi:hypothetical protein
MYHAADGTPIPCPDKDAGLYIKSRDGSLVHVTYARPATIALLHHHCVIMPVGGELRHHHVTHFGTNSSNMWRCS